MSKVFSVTCNGKTISELKKALEGALRELGDESVTTSVQLSGPTTIDDDYVDETEISNVHQMSAPFQSQEASAPTGELDSAGMPWDPSIHAATKTKVTAGTWKVRRGISDEQVAQAQAKYRVTSAPSAPVRELSPQYNNNTQSPAHQAPAQPMNMNYQGPPANHYNGPAVVQQPVQQQQAVVAPPQQNMNMNGGHTLETFVANFPYVISTLIHEKKLTQEYVNQLNAHFKVDQIWKITDEQKVACFRSFVQYGMITQVG